MRSLCNHYLFAALFVAISVGGAASTAQAAPGITERWSLFTVRAQSVSTGTLNCQAGEIALSGGYSVNTEGYSELSSRTLYDHPSDWYFVSANRPTDDKTGWTVKVSNVTSHDTLARVHVTCATGVKDSFLFAGGHGNFEAPTDLVCPEGMVVTGGGWEIGPVSRPSDIAAVKTSMPSGKDRWRVEARNDSRGTLSNSKAWVEAFAMCVSGLGGITSIRDTVTIDLPTNTRTSVGTGTGSTTCPGQLLLAGGFDKPDGESEHVLVNEFRTGTGVLSLGADTFPVSGYEGATSGPGTIGIVALCMLTTDLGTTDSTDHHKLEPHLPNTPFP